MTRRFALVLLLLAGVVLRLAVAHTLPTTYDEVSFTVALDRYDLLRFEPHFPGYPLAVLAARAARALGALAPYTVAATAAWAVATLSLRHHLTTAALLAWTPLWVLEAGRPMADALGVALLTPALALAWRTRRDLAIFRVSLLIGLAATAKPDLVLFASAPLAACCAARAPRAFGRCALGLALPALPAAFALAHGCGGWAPLLHEAQRFLHGHTTQWGGTALSSSQPRLLPALTQLTSLFGAASPLAHLTVALTLLPLIALVPRDELRAALLASFPFALYVLFAQNLAHPRHILPLLLPLAWLTDRGLRRLPAPGRHALRVTLLAAAASGTLAACTARPHPTDQLAAQIRRLDPLSHRVYAGPEARPLRWRLPTYDIRLAPSADAVRRDLALDLAPPPRLWVVRDDPPRLCPWP